MFPFLRARSRRHHRASGEEAETREDLRLSAHLKRCSGVSMPRGAHTTSRIVTYQPEGMMFSVIAREMTCALNPVSALNLSRPTVSMNSETDCMAHMLRSLRSFDNTQIAE